MQDASSENRPNLGANKPEGYRCILWGLRAFCNGFLQFCNGVANRGAVGK